MSIQKSLLLFTILLLGGCAVPVRVSSSPQTFQITNDYIELSESALLSEAEAILVGEVTAVSATQWNQENGQYWQEEVAGTTIMAFPVHTVELRLTEVLRGNFAEGETAVLTISNKSPADTEPIDAGPNGTLTGSVDHGLQVGDVVLAFVRETELAWWGGPGSIRLDRGSGAFIQPLKPVLMPLGNPATTLLRQTEDGRFHPQINATAISPIDLNTLRENLTIHNSTPSPEASQDTPTPQPTHTPSPPTPTPIPQTAVANNAPLLYYDAVSGHYFRAALDGSQPEQLTQQPDVGHAMPDLIEQSLTDFSPPRVSPNGRLLLQHGGNGQWQLLTIPTQQEIAQSDTAIYTALSWSPDSTQFAYIKEWQQLCVYTLESASEACLWESETNLFGAAWSPNGRFIAVAQNDEENEPVCCLGKIWLIDSQTGEATYATDYLAGFEHTVDSIFRWLPDRNALLIRSLPQGGAGLYFLDSDVTQPLDHAVLSGAPNGRLFYTFEGQLIDDSGQQQQQLTDPERCPDFIRQRQNVWSPDSRQIALLTSCTTDEETAVGDWTLTIFATETGALQWEKTLPKTFSLLAWTENSLFLRHQTSGWPLDSSIYILPDDGSGDPQLVVEQALFLGLFPQWIEQ